MPPAIRPTGSTGASQRTAAAATPAVAQPPSGLLQGGSIELEDDAVTGLVRQLRREGRSNPLLVHGMLLDCAVHLSTKAPVYALLAGEAGPPQPVPRAMLCVLSPGRPAGHLGVTWASAAGPPGHLSLPPQSLLPRSKRAPHPSQAC